jgi:hypothetical protein
MVRLPWQKDDGDQNWESVEDAREDPDVEGGGSGGDVGENPDGEWGESDGEDPDDESLVSCNCQDGTISVHEDRVLIERTSRSKYDDKQISMDEIVGVEYSTGFVIGYIQVEQAGVESSDGGVISSPVDENTLHFGYGVRDCASEARDAILERAAGDAAVEFDTVD